MKKDCYTHPDHPSGHFRILSGRGEIVTIICDHGRTLYSIKRADLRTCGCGRWRWARSSVNHGHASNVKPLG